MTNSQSNFYAMNLALSNVFVKYSEAIETIPALAAAVEEFNGRHSEIDANLLVQQGKITGISEQKQKEEAEMIDQTVRVASACYVYALDANNFEMLEKVSVSQYLLERMSQSKLPIVCTNVLNVALNLNGNLSNYGILPDDITKLEKEINDYTELVANPRSAIVTRSQATKQIKKLISAQRDLLNKKTDKLMLMFKESNTVFYNEYKAARIIVDMGARHKTTEEEEETEE